MVPSRPRISGYNNGHQLSISTDSVGYAFREANGQLQECDSTGKDSLKNNVIEVDEPTQ